MNKHQSLHQLLWANPHSHHHSKNLSSDLITRMAPSRFGFLPKPKAPFSFSQQTWCVCPCMSFAPLFCLITLSRLLVLLYNLSAWSKGNFLVSFLFLTVCSLQELLSTHKLMLCTKKSSLDTSTALWSTSSMITWLKSLSIRSERSLPRTTTFWPRFLL